MITSFKQESSIVSLVKLLNNKDADIRAEAILAVGKLSHKKTEEQLIKMYDNEPFICQKEIIKALSRFKTKESIPFLEEAYYSANSSELRKIIVEVIFRHNAEGKQLFESLKSKESGFNLLIFDHIENPLIPSDLGDNTSDKEVEKEPSLEESFALSV